MRCGLRIIRAKRRENNFPAQPAKDLMNRSNDWLSQAIRDLEEAKWNLKGEFYEWACFSAQQSAEKAVKGLCEELKQASWGHAVSKLLAQLQKTTIIPSDLIEKAQKLDRFYIPTRYPNGFEQGAPMDYYLKEDAQEAIKHAQEIIDFCKKKIKTRR